MGNWGNLPIARWGCTVYWFCLLQSYLSRLRWRMLKILIFEGTMSHMSPYPWWYPYWSFVHYRVWEKILNFDEFLKYFFSSCHGAEYEYEFEYKWNFFINFSTFYLSVVNAKSPVLVVCGSFIAIEINLNNKRDVGGVKDRVGGGVCITIHSSTAEPSKVVVYDWSGGLKIEIVRPFQCNSFVLHYCCKFLRFVYDLKHWEYWENL